jgi:hypothetical protein
MAPKGHKRKVKPAAWGITHNPARFSEFDPFRDDNVMVWWSLADNYRTTEQMAPGDRVVFWQTAPIQGIVRVGFVLGVDPCPDGYWDDDSGTRQETKYQGRFYLPPFPRNLFIPRDFLLRSKAFASCELVIAGRRQAQPPLRIEPAEWKVVERAIERMNRELGGPTSIRG